MLYTVISLNPSIDRILKLSSPIEVGGLNRIADCHAYPAGKGVNVARVLRRLVDEDDQVSLCTFLGQESIALFRETVENEGICLHILPTDRPTRSCYKVMSPDGSMTELNESGGPYGDEEMKVLAEAVASIVENGSNQLVFLCGSIPQGVDKDVYNLMITLFKSCGIKVVLDCDGEALSKGVEASPFLIKPNIFELSQLAGCDLSTTAEAVDFAKKLSVEKSIAVLCTTGEKGSFLTVGERVWQVSCPQVSTVCPSGAGDSYLAAFVAGMTEREDSPYPSELPNEPIDEARLIKALKWGAAAAAAKVETEGSLIPSEEAMRKRVGQVTVTRL